MYAGVPTAWVRFFNCNLQCNGFGQKDPTDPSTYVLPYQDIDVTKYNRIEDLPVFKFGCDSSYSWSAKFKHLQYEGTGAEIVSRIRDALKTTTNPRGLFQHPMNTNLLVKPYTTQHLCFTGGEPLLPINQRAVVDVLDSFGKEEDRFNDRPSFLTFETNGTQTLSEQLVNILRMISPEVTFSVSPKLFSVSGEDNKKAIHPEIVDQYEVIGNVYLKFVCNGTEQCWDELDEAVSNFRKYARLRNTPVWVMPAGAQLEDQQKVAGDIARQAFNRGYNIASRVHCYLWGNQIGT